MNQYAMPERAIIKTPKKEGCAGRDFAVVVALIILDRDK